MDVFLRQKALIRAKMQPIPTSLYDKDAISGASHPVIRSLNRQSLPSEE